MTSVPKTVEPYRFTVADVERMVESGILAEADRVELAEGNLFRMPPQSAPHAMLTALVRRLLEDRRGPGFHARDHSPLDLSEHDQPQPAVALVRGKVGDYAQRHPTGAETLLVVEVAQSSLTHDRRKAAVYARASIPTYWVIIPERRRVELHPQPNTDGAYRVTETVDAGGVLELPDRPGETLAVDELLP